MQLADSEGGFYDKLDELHESRSREVLQEFQSLWRIRHDWRRYGGFSGKVEEARQEYEK